MVTILGISGSLRRESWNTKLLKEAVTLCPKGATIELLDWGDLPVFNQDVETTPPDAVRAAKERIKAADAVLSVTPEYNYSVPGPLKNMIDWCSRPYGDSAWQGKPVAVMGASPGAGGTVRAQMALRQSFLFLDMQPVMSPEVFVRDCASKFDAKGAFTDEKGKEIIAVLLARLIELTRRLKG